MKQTSLTYGPSMFTRMLARRLVPLLVLTTFAGRASGQQTSPIQAEKPASGQPGIQDNSFLIEEAYNQEEGVVQHISNGLFTSRPQRDFVYTLTQEWPMGGQTHQFSFTVPYLFLDSNTIRGLGDVLLNYRYQLLINEAWAVAPRLSLVLPTGTESSGLGNGVFGFQAAIPVSSQLSENFVAHFNVGVTVLPNVEGIAAVKRTIVTEYVGSSLVWLAEHNFNVFLEGVVSNNGGINDGGEVEHILETILNPGVRFAINLGGLQIVPGIAFPFFLQQQQRTGILLYLSFEHPF